METVLSNNPPAPTYNNCFVLGCKSKNDEGKPVKVPAYIDRNGTPQRLYGGKDGPLRSLYEMTYEQAQQILDGYMSGGKRTRGDDTLRVSLFLENAMFGDLHVFVLDFDEYDEESVFFQRAKGIADKVTRSQSGGYHMFYGVHRETATPLFDSINLLASGSAKSYVSKTGAVTRDGKNKVDLFCDAHHFMYEWEPWDNAVGLTDRTQDLFLLLRDNFSWEKPLAESKAVRTTRSNGAWTPLPECSAEELTAQMTDCQRVVFDDLKGYSSDCDRERWFSLGLDIYHAFGAELGGGVFLWWSKPGRSFNPQGCARTWEAICQRGPNTRPIHLAVSAF